ncbi:MAG TPA: hypothetical protein VLL08_06685 [Kineosporiaceae bacterium]|nr:hypothetical protein [Kineosporiaceae bacterium]
MSTSIRDLLGEAGRLQSQHRRTRANPAAAGDARLVIGAAGTVLSKLEVWRPDWTHKDERRQLTDQLREACAAVHAGNHPPRSSRSHLLMAAAADAAGVLCGPAVTAADRWDITVVVADLVRRSTTTYQVYGPAIPDPAIAAARTAAINVARAGLRLPSQQLRRSLVDLPIPSPPRLVDHPLERAVAAAAEIDYLLARTVTDDTREFASLYELRAIARAFEHTAQRAAAAVGVPSNSGAAWGNVRVLARLLHDGQRPAIDAPETLVRSAAQLHHALDQHPEAEPAASDRLLYAELLWHVANSADSLTFHVPRMAGRVYARADQYPVPEARVEQHLHRQSFIADITDLAILKYTLRTAERSTATLADLLTDPTGMDPRTAPYPLTDALPPPPLAAMTPSTPAPAPTP